MRARNYVDMELKQLYNENDTPYVSKRSRSNPFYEGGVDIEEIFDDVDYTPRPSRSREILRETPRGKPKEGKLALACSMVPIVKTAVKMAEQGCYLTGNGCPMCCGGKKGKHSGGCADCTYCKGGCAGCPYCDGNGCSRCCGGKKGKRRGGVGEATLDDEPDDRIPVIPSSSYTFEDRPYMSDEEIVNMNNTKLLKVLKERFGIDVNLVDPNLKGQKMKDARRKARRRAWEQFSDLSDSDKIMFFRQHEEKRRGYPVEQPAEEPYYVGRPEQSAEKPYYVGRHKPEQSYAISTIDARKYPIGRPREVLQQGPSIVERSYDLIVSPEGVQMMNLASRGFTSASQYIKGLLSAVKAEEKKDIEVIKHLEPDVRKVIKTVQQAVPDKAIEKAIREGKPLEPLKDAIKETYGQCLARFPKGQKQINCIHLTSKYVSGKINEIDVRRLYHTYSDCMKNTESGQKRTRCYPLTKKAQGERKQKAMTRTSARNKKVNALAKKLKSTHPNLSYLERIKLARKSVK